MKYLKMWYPEGKPYRFLFSREPVGFIGKPDPVVEPGEKRAEVRQLPEQKPQTPPLC